MSAPTPDKLLENIIKWTEERTKFILEEYANPMTHFSIFVKEPEPHKITPVTVAYPKGHEDIVQMGWGWRPKEIDRKAYAAIKDRSRKRSVLGSLNAECINRGLTLIVKPNIDNLEEIQIITSIPIDSLTGDKYYDALINLMLMWGFLMHQFQQHNMSRAGFNPADYI